jgi:uncharacterized protein (DUF433 family)
VQPRGRGLGIPVALVLRHLAAGDRSSTIVGEYPELEVEVIGARLRLAAWLASGRSLDVPRVA